MKRKLAIFSLIGLLIVLGGKLTMNFQGNGDIPGAPEGYEEPAGRVEKLKIEAGVYDYYDKNLDLVAFGPGSGWLKFKTMDEGGPTLSFDRITQKDVKKFNEFSLGLGLPVRVGFSRNVLCISSGDSSDEPEKNQTSSPGENRSLKKGQSTRLVIRKDISGKVFLVKAGPGKGSPVTRRDKDMGTP